ncbi:MAG: ParB N-terminal domain-containing protein [Magnetospirillum sp.]|nr:ParB N-terminal domain-containing protein [Magnetospirillum sp.]
MKSLGRATLAIADIVIGDRLRRIDPDRARMLADNIVEVGALRQPPEVRRQVKGGAFVHTLIAGAHRIGAVELLGWTEIECELREGSDDEARLWEIDENLVRHELNPLDRAVFLAERKAIYLRLHPETGHGGDRKSKKSSGHDVHLIGFARDTAARCGLNRKTIDRAVSIVEKLAADVRATIAGTALAQKQSELLALTKLGHGEQRQVLALLLAEQPKARNVAAALKLVRGVHDAGPGPDLHFKKMVEHWGRAAPAERTAFLTWLLDHPKDDTLRGFIAALDQAEAA